MLSLKLARQFLFSKKREAFISMNAFLSITATALSVFVLLVVIAVMSGFSVTLKEKIMGMSPPITLTGSLPLHSPASYVTLLKKNPKVLQASPYVYGHAMLEHKNKIYGVTLHGLEPLQGFSIINLEKYLILGSQSLKTKEILIGSELAKILGVSLHDELTIQSPGGNGGPFPSQIIFTISGIFESGLLDLDSTLTFVTLDDAKKLYGFEEHVHGIALSVINPDHVALIKKELLSSIPKNLSLTTWLEKNKSFFSALKSEKNMMFVLLTLTILIASMNIVSTLVMLVMEKVKDIGILKSIGFTKFMILKIFLFQGFMIGSLGTLIGVCSGLLFIKHIDTIETTFTRLTGLEAFPDDVFYFEHIPTHLEHQDLILIVFLSMTVSSLAALYPALRAASLKPIEALRYE